MSSGSKPAFPSYFQELETCSITGIDLPASKPSGGLTKREYFAGLAMQSMLGKSTQAEYVARTAVDMANALIAELERTSSND